MSQQTQHTPEDWRDTMYDVCMRRAERSALEACAAWRLKHPVGEMSPQICSNAQFYVSIAQTLHLADEEACRAALLNHALYPAAAKRLEEMPSAIGPAWKPVRRAW